MESAPRPGYYPDPSVPGYIRYWDGSRWVPGTSKPMPEGVGEAEAEAEAPSQAPTYSARPVLPDMNFDDLLPPELEPETESQSPAPAPEQHQGPVFPTPPSMSAMSFDAPNGMADAAPNSGFDSPSLDSGPNPIPGPRAGFPAPPVANASGMGISITGPGAPQAAPGPTPAQVAATSQALRIRLLRPDGKPFDGPEITTGPKEPDSPAGASRTGFDAAQRGTKKQAPKVVVKTGPLERIGHLLAVLAISAIGILPLGYLLLQSVHDREDKLAAKITTPTKMNVLNGTSDAYLAAMAAVLLVVAVVYRTRLKRRRER